MSRDDEGNAYFHTSDVRRRDRMRDKEQIAAKKEELIRITGEFCDDLLDDEYKQLAEKLIQKMSRKRQVPFLSGKIELWAAGILYALGQINFLFVKRSEPHIQAGYLCQVFGLSMGSVSTKARRIREMFRMDHWNSEFLSERAKRRSMLPHIAELVRLLHLANVKGQEKESREEPQEKVPKKPLEKKGSHQKSLDEFL